MTRVFQFLTVINLVGLIILAVYQFRAKEPSQSSVPAPAASSSSAPTLTPMSTPPPTVNTQPGEIKGEAGKPQAVDVLTGDVIDRNLYGDYEGKRVYFCHAGSKTRFEQNVQTNLQKIQDKGIVLASAPGK